MKALSGSHFTRIRLGGQRTALLLLAALAGCASTPDSPRVSISPSPAYRHAPAQTIPASTHADWWQGFADERLATLLSRTAAVNLDIRLAVARVRQARAGQDASASRLYPSIDLGASHSDSRTGLPAAAKQTLPDTRATRAGLELGWEIDLFGGARAARSAAQHDAAAAVQGVAGAQLLAVSEVARQYFLWQGARQRLAILETLLQNQRDTERLVQNRQREGLASEFEVVRAAGETRALAAALPPLRTLLAVTEHRIAVLSGTDASQPVVALQATDTYAWTLPAPAVLGQPIDLLRRRPDLLAAEQTLAAQSARLAEARANRYPKMFLGAVFGQQDLTLNDSLNLPTARYSNVALAFALPLFTAGRVEAGIEAQGGREQEALLDYEKALLGAIEEVENSLVALGEEQQRIESLQQALDARRQAVRHAKALYREGQIDLLALLDAQRGQLAGELALAESQAQHAMDHVQLYKALGGSPSPIPTGVTP